MRHLHLGGTATHDGVDQHRDCHHKQEITRVKQVKVD